MTTRAPVAHTSGVRTHKSQDSETLRRLSFETQAHIKRVQELAVVLFKDQFLDTHTDLSLADVEAYMALHDAPKLMSLEELRNWGYEGEKTFMERLSRFYGVGECEELKSVTEELNAIEDRIKSSQFSHLSVSQLDSLKEIERVADVTDTAMNRSEELNFESQQLGGALYLEAEGNDYLAAASAYLEITYLS